MLPGWMGSLDEWRTTVEGRIGFDDDQKQLLLLSAATDNGIRITGMSMGEPMITQPLPKF